MGDLILILGGAKSGKTGYALSRCAAFAPPRLYLATAEAGDAEMADRIARHQRERGPEWRTLEEPLRVAEAISGLTPADASVILLDCLTLWLGNRMAVGDGGLDALAAEADRLVEAARNTHCPVIMVGNEVGGGIVPNNALARRFRDGAGLIHQKLAAAAAEVQFVVAGLPLRLK